jgi:hypothetical protein
VSEQRGLRPGRREGRGPIRESHEGRLSPGLLAPDIAGVAVEAALTGVDAVSQPWAWGR